MDGTKFGLTLVGALVFVGLMYFVLAPNPDAAPESATIPATTTAAKINIDAICAGALAYMTFPSSTEADTFVQECKDGKHPEVIDKWKSDNGIQDDKAI
jgi:hypothetical protein